MGRLLFCVCTQMHHQAYCDPGQEVFSEIICKSMGGYLNRLYDPIFEGLLVHSNPRLIKTISESLMDKKDYIIRQLGRTKHKKYESYVVSRIFHLLDDLDIKFITQQYVSRPEGRALTDLYFPQIQLHVEVDEEHHKSNVEDDRIREADIVNATGHEVVGIDVSTSIEQINDSLMPTL